MATTGEVLAQYSNQSQMSSYFTDKMGILSILSYANSQAIYDGVTSAATALTATLADIPTAGGIIFFPSTENGYTYRIDTNITIPSNVTLWFANGAKIKRTNSAIITLNCGIQAGLHQIFEDDGTGSWGGSPYCDRLYPEWFGYKDHASVSKKNQGIKLYRKFKPLLGASPWWLINNNSPQTQNYILADLLKFKEMGIDTMPYLCHVLINGSGQLYIAEGTSNFTYAYNTAKSLGININAVKFHVTTDVISAYTGNFQADYKTLIQSMCSVAQGKATYFTVLNEVPTIYWNASYQSFVIDLLQTVKSYGFSVGITNVGLSDAITIDSNTWILNYIDCIFINHYPSISFNGSKATYSDSLNAWYHLREIDYLKINYNKPIIISESGVQHFWECLSNPARYDWTGVAQTDGQGDVASTFLYGLFNSLSINRNVEEVWLWYPEQMHYSNVYNLINEYTGGDAID